MIPTDKKLQLSLFEMLARLAEKEEFGTVKVLDGEREIVIDLIKGRIVNYKDSGLSEFFIVERLAEARLISNRKAQKVKRYIWRKKIGPIAAIMKKCSLSADIACKIAEQFVRELILDLLLKKGLQVSFSGGRPAVAEYLRTPIPVWFLLKEARRRASELPKILEKINENTVLKKVLPPPHVAPGESILWENFPFNPHERRLYLFIDSVSTLKELSRKSGFTDFETLRVAYSLLEKKFVEEFDGLDTLDADKKPGYLKQFLQGLFYLLLILLYALLFGRLGEVRDSVVAFQEEDQFRLEMRLIGKASLIDRLDAFYLLNGAYPEDLERLKREGLLPDHGGGGEVLTYRPFESGFVINWR